MLLMSSFRKEDHYTHHLYYHVTRHVAGRLRGVRVYGGYVLDRGAVMDLVLAPGVTMPDGKTQTLHYDKATRQILPFGLPLYDILELRMLVETPDGPRTLLASTRKDKVRYNARFSKKPDTERRKKRTSYPVGEAAPSSKLTEDAVREIRARKVEEGLSDRALAAEYGVSKSSIANVISRKTWADV